MALKSIVYKNTTLDISYEYVDGGYDTLALILHGWGASKELMHQALSELKCNQIYIDLPGFGRSSEMTRSFDSIDYTQVVREFLRATEPIYGRVSVLVGHSYGGKLCTLVPKHSLAKTGNVFEPSDDGDTSIKLVLLSAAGYTLPKPLSVRARIIIYKIARKCGLGALRGLFVSADARGMSEVMYETFKRVVDEDIKQILRTTPNETLILWGADDSATKVSAGRGFASIMPNAKLHIIDGDHFFFLREKSKCVNIINDFLAKH